MSWWLTLTHWLDAHGTFVWGLSIASLAALLVTPAIVVWLVTKLPADYFLARDHRPLSTLEKFPALRLVLLTIKASLGFVLLTIGLAMLIAPGQGLLTITAGLILAEFPGKRRLERWLATRRHVWRSLNWIRRRAGQCEFAFPS